MGKRRTRQPVLLPRVEDDPTEWRIIISSDEGKWFETAGTFTEFLVRCFHRIDHPDFMDSSWPRPGARYEARA
ncbi:hypothetical protein OG618_08155 [Kitasatospora sp. NBC_01246]|uniref:hypothetical protein n=1 Tax=Kitasatospora sp. NBC_01246 TaxID=2903570 RepID=UPI002E34A0F1|nr:hypothetical protein [Kitasatospora sp. NBC_01246]